LSYGLSVSGFRFDCARRKTHYHQPITEEPQTWIPPDR
jgi:hypothetical protein